MVEKLLLDQSYPSGVKSAGHAIIGLQVVKSPNCAVGPSGRMLYSFFMSQIVPYQLYYDGELEGQRKPIHTVGQGAVLYTADQW